MNRGLLKLAAIGALLGLPYEDTSSRQVRKNKLRHKRDREQLNKITHNRRRNRIARKSRAFNRNS